MTDGDSPALVGVATATRPRRAEPANGAWSSALVGTVVGMVVRMVVGMVVGAGGITVGAKAGVACPAMGATRCTPGSTVPWAEWASELPSACRLAPETLQMMTRAIMGK